jgi:uncharacterized membrane protein HdeD (DUF308 family)/predicted flap endonuclease-1-like 5' DNA nuclease
MTAAVDRAENRLNLAPWWLVLIEGILAIIVGILLWMYPVRAFIWLSVFIGVYWIISGIFDIVSIFFNHTAWGWKLFMGIVGIIAGGFLASQAIAGAIALALTTVLIIGLIGIFYGILGLFRAFQGAGWGAGILGVVSIIFGVFILVNRGKAALALPWMFGLLGIFGGLLAIFAAFALRSAQKSMKSAKGKADEVSPMPEVAQRSAEIPAAPAAAAAAGSAAAVAVADKTDEIAPEAIPTPVESGSAENAAALVDTTAGEEVVAEKAAPEVEELEDVDIPEIVEIPEEQARFLKQEIEYVEGIGPVYGAKLRAIGINTPLDLLKKGATRKGRELIAAASGITGTLILKWVNHTDLYRLKGVGSEYADLLEAAGVDTVVELATRNPANLHEKLAATNADKKLVRQVPSLAQVEDWVTQAKQLGRVVTY